MKKLIISLIFTALAGLSFAFGPEDIHTYTLESGLHVFVLSDTTSALVRLELSVNAGYSAQSQKDAGFFPLYARLLSASEMGSDSVKFIRTVAPSDTEKSLAELSSFFTPLNPDDRTLRTALNEMKNSLTEYEASAAGFINTTVDSRIFPSAPWKSESGVYPALFKSTTLSQCRTILETIARRYYRPSNANLFISGNISSDQALALCQQYFASLEKTTAPVQKVENLEIQNKSRKFVLSDKDLSSDLTQIIIQYTDFSRDEADLLSVILNDDSLAFKNRLSEDDSLAILGNEYIDVSSVQQKGSSRLVMQSLLERTKKSPCAQAERFLSLADFTGTFELNEVRWATGLFDSALARRRDDSAAMMELLSSWISTSSDDVEKAKEKLFSRTDSFAALDAGALAVKEQMQSPYVFVLVNSSVYQKYAKEFSKAGYQLVTRKNGSWYSQDVYKKLLKEKKTETVVQSREDSAKRFIEENIKQFSSFTLDNGIPVTVKTIPGAENTSLVLEISGGELLFAKKNPGIADVLTNSLASNIRNQIDYFSSQGYVKGSCDVRAETFAPFGRITLKCEMVDLPACIAASGQALVYADIAPALADGIAYDLRTQWRLSTGTATFQLLCEAVRNLYGKPISNLYNDKDDKPESLEYTQIALNYPTLLDSSRLSIVVAGGIQDQEVLKDMLNQSFAVLESRKATESLEKTIGEPAFNGKSKRVSIRHLFLTDISADKAGPRPAVLVPTKNFYDPVLYCLACPQQDSTDAALFNALLYDLAARLQEKVNGDQRVLMDCPDSNLPFARLYVTNVVRTTEIDRLYRQAVEELKEDLENLVAIADDLAMDIEKNPWLASVENRWLMTTLAQTGTVDGSAQLIQESLAKSGDASLYLKQYQAVHQAKAADYYLLSQFYLTETPGYTVYSADSKR